MTYLSFVHWSWELILGKIVLWMQCRTGVGDDTVHYGIRVPRFPQTISQTL